MHQCCAVGCKNIGIHLFPKNDKIRKRWEIAVCRKNFTATKHSRLCSDHFTAEDYRKEGFETGMKLKRRMLKKGVIPSLFVWSRKETLNDEQRRKRVEKREARRKGTDMSNDVINAESEICGSPVIDDNNCAMEVDVSDLNVSSDYVPKPLTATCEVGTQKNFKFFTIGRFQDDLEAIRFYTGLESFEKFKFVYYTLCSEANSLKFRWSQMLNLSLEDQLFLTLIKLRRNKQDYELGLLFDISPTSVSNVFVTWVNFMHQMWSALNIWPSKDLVQFYMPEGFKKHYPTTRVIVDCTEIPVQRPTNPAAQQALWSSYENRCTVKLEIGATPSGLLCHCSEAYGGSTSDRQIVERSNLLCKCEHGDSIMADRDFNVQDIFAPKGVTINIPAFLKGRNQLPGITVMEDRKLASKRIHIERLIGLTITFRFLQQPVCNKYLKLMTKIYFVCQMLCNFRENIVSHKA